MENSPNITDIDVNAKYRPKNIPIETILEYRNKGLSPPQIAKLLNCNKSNIFRRLQKIDQELNHFQNYKKHRADIIGLKSRQILKHMDDAKLEKASAYQLAGMFGILYDKERLERDKSTQNVGMVLQNIAYLRTIDDDK